MSKKFDHKPAYSANYRKQVCITVLADVFEVAETARKLEAVRLGRTTTMPFNEFLNRALIEYIRKIVGQRAGNSLYRKYFREIENDKVDTRKCLIKELEAQLKRLAGTTMSNDGSV